MADFQKAQEIDENCADIYHHRGQVNLLTEQVKIIVFSSRDGRQVAW